MNTVERTNKRKVSRKYIGDFTHEWKKRGSFKSSQCFFYEVLNFTTVNWAKLACQERPYKRVNFVVCSKWKKILIKKGVRMNALDVTRSECLRDQPLLCNSLIAVLSCVRQIYIERKSDE